MTSRTPIRVVVAAGTAMLAATRRALQAAGIVVAAECADAAGAVDAVERLRPDVLVLDNELTGGALVATAAVSTPAAPPPVLVIGPDAGGPERRAAELAGAARYLGSETGDELLADTVSDLAHKTQERNES